MNWRNTALLILVFGLAGVGWLAFQRFPHISYMTSDYEAITGFSALKAGWPIYSFIFVLVTLIGLLLGGWLGITTRERDAAEHLDTRESMLAEKQRQAENAEQKAREKTASAEQARRDAEALIAPSQQRINDLSEENATLKRRLTGSVEALTRKKRQVRELRQNDSEALLAEIERLRGMIREDRQQIQRFEERLRIAKSAVS